MSHKFPIIIVDLYNNNKIGLLRYAGLVLLCGPFGPHWEWETPLSSKLCGKIFTEKERWLILSDKLAIGQPQILAIY